MRDISIIAAFDKNRAIGRKGTIPWHMPSDLAYFQRVTDGSVVIMGRKTWESLPNASRPLKGRINVVVTRNRRTTYAGAITAHSLEHALALTEGVAPQFVIGGEGLYAEAMPLAQRLFLTEVECAYSGMDAYFPPIDNEDDWAVLRTWYGRAAGDNHHKRVVEMTRKANLIDMSAVAAAAEAAHALGLFQTHVGGNHVTS